MLHQTLYSTPHTIPHSTIHFNSLHTPLHIVLQSMPHFPFYYKFPQYTLYSMLHYAFTPLHTLSSSSLHMLIWSISPFHAAQVIFLYSTHHWNTINQTQLWLHTKRYFILNPIHYAIFHYTFQLNISLHSIQYSQLQLTPDHIPYSTAYPAAYSTPCDTLFHTAPHIFYPIIHSILHSTFQSKPCSIPFFISLHIYTSPYPVPYFTTHLANKIPLTVYTFYSPPYPSKILLQSMFYSKIQYLFYFTPYAGYILHYEFEHLLYTIPYSTTPHTLSHTPLHISLHSILYSIVHYTPHSM